MVLILSRQIKEFLAGGGELADLEIQSNIWLINNSRELIVALINCGECKTEMSDKADKRPKCGAPAKKKTSLFTWIVVGFLGIGFIGALTGNKSSTPLLKQLQVQAH